MPRGGGGGGFRGGGFSGGGFSGGFSGGGFRGSSGSFRVGSIRSSGRPFGRTGATRNVSRPSSGPYRHTYYRPRSHYWGWYGYRYRPWYWRWWHYPRFWGYYYRPWYYSPVYIGGSLILLIVLPLIILPILGVAFAYPFGGGISSNGTVNYRSTETLYFNEYWYEYEDVDTNSIIEYDIASSPGIVDFIIWKGNFDSIPTSLNDTDHIFDTKILTSNRYEYEWMFLRPGSTIHYNFTATDSIEFFIADTQNIISWEKGQYAYLHEHQTSVVNASGEYDISSAGDFYIVWYNEDGPTVNVDIDVYYEDVEDFNFSGVPSDEYVFEGGVDSAVGTFTVPTDGRWYFFIYFNPIKSPEETMDITFDVTYELGDQASVKAWIGARPWLVFFGVVAVVLIIMAIFNRRKQKEFKTTASDTPKAQTQSQTVVVQQKPPATSECPRCHSPMKATDIYCNACGEKREGRRVGMQTTTERDGHCDYCGAILPGSAKFCTSCGSRIK